MDPTLVKGGGGDGHPAFYWSRGGGEGSPRLSQGILGGGGRVGRRREAPLHRHFLYGASKFTWEFCISVSIPAGTATYHMLEKTLFPNQKVWNFK